MVQLSQRLLRLGSQRVARITVQEFLEGLARGIVVAEVLLVNLPDGEQRLEAILAAGILAAQELVLAEWRRSSLSRRAETGGPYRPGSRRPRPRWRRLYWRRARRNRPCDRHRRPADSRGECAARRASVQRLAHLLGLVELIAGLLLARSCTAGKTEEAGAQKHGQSVHAPTIAARSMACLGEERRGAGWLRVLNGDRGACHLHKLADTSRPKPRLMRLGRRNAIRRRLFRPEHFDYRCRPDRSNKRAKAARNQGSDPLAECPDCGPQSSQPIYRG